MIQEITICDLCGMKKGESKPWFLACEAPDGKSVTFSTWDTPTIGAKHICGQQCAQEFLEQALHNWSK